jgi:hypothetical protein
VVYPTDQPNLRSARQLPATLDAATAKGIMRFLNWNHRKVQNLTPWEIWAFIAGRVLMSFGFGVLAVRYIPRVADPLGILTLVTGIICLVFAAKGLARKNHSYGSAVQQSLERTRAA